jgi:hypothetical protein
MTKKTSKRRSSRRLRSNTNKLSHAEGKSLAKRDRRVRGAILAKITELQRREENLREQADDLLSDADSLRKSLESVLKAADEGHWSYLCGRGIIKDTDAESLANVSPAKYILDDSDD